MDHNLFILYTMIAFMKMHAWLTFRVYQASRTNAETFIFLTIFSGLRAVEGMQYHYDRPYDLSHISSRIFYPHIKRSKSAMKIIIACQEERIHLNGLVSLSRITVNIKKRWQLKKRSILCRNCVHFNYNWFRKCTWSSTYEKSRPSCS